MATRGTFQALGRYMALSSQWNSIDRRSMLALLVRREMNFLWGELSPYFRDQISRRYNPTPGDKKEGNGKNISN